MKLMITGLKVTPRATRQGEPWLYAELRDVDRSENHQIISIAPIEACIEACIHSGVKSVEIDLTGISKDEIARAT